MKDSIELMEDTLAQMDQSRISECEVIRRLVRVLSSTDRVITPLLKIVFVRRVVTHGDYWHEITFITGDGYDESAKRKEINERTEALILAAKWSRPDGRDKRK